MIAMACTCLHMVCSTLSGSSAAGSPPVIDPMIAMNSSHDCDGLHVLAHGLQYAQRQLSRRVPTRDAIEDCKQRRAIPRREIITTGGRACGRGLGE